MGNGPSKSNVMAISPQFEALVESRSNIFSYGPQRLVAEISGEPLQTKVDMFGMPAFLMRVRMAYSDDEIKAICLGNSTWIPHYHSTNMFVWKELVQQVHESQHLQARVSYLSGEYPDQITADFSLFVNGQLKCTCKIWMLPPNRPTL